MPGLRSEDMPTRDAFRLFLLGFLTLFLELVLIRYLAGNVWNLGYFPNLVLMAVFVGMGIGFTLHQRLSERASQIAFTVSACLLLVLAGVVTWAHPTVPGFGAHAAELEDELFFSRTPREADAANALLFCTWFVVTIAVFAALAQRTAKLFRAFTPLKAYTLDIAGSCCGIVAFSVMSWMTWPAHVWFACVAALYLLGASRLRGRLTGLAVLAVLGAGALSAFQDTRLLARPSYRGPVLTIWSPYQKVEYVHVPDSAPYRVFVNGIAHQSMRDAAELKDPNGRIPYAFPYRHRLTHPDLAPYRRVLVLGAGTGNDVAAALQNGADLVDAVEIDPVIADLGRRFHPLKPYADRRVRLSVEDGRSFIGRRQGRYDLIVFALTDSLVKVSARAQLRLENYLFTEQSVARAYWLLSDEGDLLFYNYYRQAWLCDKIEALIGRATGRTPERIFTRDNFVMLRVGRHDVAARSPDAQAAVDTPTDDWPFLYLRGRRIPRIYLLVMSALTVLLGALLLALQRSARRESTLQDARALSVKLSFVMMGIAFLLLETKSVIQFSLLFGTTWLNNSLVFLGILLLVLAANWTALRLRPSHIHAVYLLLLASCLLTLVFPLGCLLDVESMAWRFLAAVLLTFLPVFFANLIFGLVFRDQRVPEHLFGWNLIGATLGGVAEYSSLALGYNRLTWIVCACYTLAFGLLVLGRRPALSAAEQPAPAGA